MGTPWTLVDSLRGLAGLTDIRSSGKGAVPPGAPLPQTPPEAEIAGPDQAAGYVSSWVAAGADCIKITLMQPGLDQATLNALATAAREHGKLTIAHAPAFQKGSLAAQPQSVPLQLA